MSAARRTVRGLVHVLVLLSALAATAQPRAPTSAGPGSDETVELGRQWDVKGLESILDAHDLRRLSAYVRGFRQTAVMREGKLDHEIPIPPEVETLIVKHYRDPGAAPILANFFFSGALYQSRALFDLMYSDLRTKDREPLLLLAIFSTTLQGIEPPLLDYLRSLPPSMPDAKALTTFMAKRRYAPAVPVLAGMLQSAPPPSGADIAVALLEMGNAEATAAVLHRLERLRDPAASRDAAIERHAILQEMAIHPSEVHARPEDVRRALPVQLDATEAARWSDFIRVAQRRSNSDALLEQLSDAKQFPSAIQAIVASGSRPLQMSAMSRLDRLQREGSIEMDPYEWGKHRLARVLFPGPARGTAAPVRDRAAQLAEKRRGLDESLRDALPVSRRIDPQAYFEAQLAYLHGKEGLLAQYGDIAGAALKQEVGDGYRDLGHFARFSLKRPDRAMELYERSRRYGERMAAFAEADLAQFDRGDRKGALERYRAILASMPPGRSTNEVEATVANGARLWLEHQVDYLEHGRSFEGPVAVDDCGLVALVMVYGAGMQGEIDPFGVRGFGAYAAAGLPGGKPIPERKRTAIAEAIQRLPPSSFVLLNTGNLVGALPDADAILAHFHKHDPAGFATACYFTLLDTMIAKAKAAGANGAAIGEAPLAAAERYRAAHGFAAPKADPRYASPEKTWRTFVAALKRGDAGEAMRCLTPGQRNKFRALFEGRPATELRAMGESFTGFALSAPANGDYLEAFVTRGKQAGAVSFVNRGGEWKIDEM